MSINSPQAGGCDASQGAAGSAQPSCVPTSQGSYTPDLVYAQDKTNPLLVFPSKIPRNSPRRGSCEGKKVINSWWHI